MLYLFCSVTWYALQNPYLEHSKSPNFPHLSKLNLLSLIKVILTAADFSVAQASATFKIKKKKERAVLGQETLGLGRADGWMTDVIGRG